jgi:hypothetical protein
MLNIPTSAREDFAGEGVGVGLGGAERRRSGRRIKGQSELGG